MRIAALLFVVALLFSLTPPLPVQAVGADAPETTFYAISVYFGAAGIKNTRYAVPAALLADLTGFVTAAWSVRLFYALGLYI